MHLHRKLADIEASLTNNIFLLKLQNKKLGDSIGFLNTLKKRKSFRTNIPLGLSIGIECNIENNSPVYLRDEV